MGILFDHLFDAIRHSRFTCWRRFHDGSFCYTVGNTIVDTPWYMGAERIQDGRKRLAVLFLATGVSITSIAPSGLSQIENGVFGIEGITEESHWYTEEWRAKAELAGNEVKPLLKTPQSKW